MREVLLIGFLLFVSVNICFLKTFKSDDKKYLVTILVAYILYIIMHMIPSFEYYTVKYTN